MSFGVARQRAPGPAPIPALAGPQVWVGEVLREPLPLGARALTLVRVQGGPVRVWLPPTAIQGAALPGARVRIEGSLKPWPQGSHRAALRARWLSQRGLAGEVQAHALVEEEPGRGLGALAAAWRGALRASLERRPPVERALLRAVLLGERVSLPQKLREAFASTGCAHLLSISGLHVGLLAGLLLGVLRLAGCGSLSSRIGVALGLLFFLALVGTRPPTLRASVAGLVWLLLPWRGEGLNRLAVALCAVLAVDPQAPDSLGFRLSFGTVALLIALSPPLLRDAHRPRPHLVLKGARRWLRLGAVAVCVPFLASLPGVGLELRLLPLASLVLNPLAVPLFACVLGLAFPGMALGVVWPGAGDLLLGAAGTLLRALCAMVLEGAQALPGEPLAPVAALSSTLACALLALAWARRQGAWRHGCGARAWGLTALLLLCALILPRPRPQAPPALIVRGRWVAGRARSGGWEFGRAPSPRLRAAALARLGLSARALPRPRLRVPGGAFHELGPRTRVLVVRHPGPFLRAVGRGESVEAEVLVLLCAPSASQLRRLWARVRPGRVLVAGSFSPRAP